MSGRPAAWERTNERRSWWRNLCWLFDHGWFYEDSYTRECVHCGRREIWN